MGELVNPFQRGRGGPGGWWIIDQPEVHLVRDVEVVVPDLGGWQRAHMVSVPQDHRFEVVPDWICEILSQPTASKDREVEMPLYARYGVRYAWIVDPMQRTLEVYALQKGDWVELQRYSRDHRVAAQPFQAITIDLVDLCV